MVGKRVRVFWLVNSRWYIANVQQYNALSDEHLLQYPDDDTKYILVKIIRPMSNREYLRHISSMNVIGGINNNINEI